MIREGGCSPISLSNLPTSCLFSKKKKRLDSDRLREDSQDGVIGLLARSLHPSLSQAIVPLIKDMPLIMVQPVGTDSFTFGPRARLS